MSQTTVVQRARMQKDYPKVDLISASLTLFSLFYNGFYVTQIEVNPILAGKTSFLGWLNIPSAAWHLEETIKSRGKALAMTITERARTFSAALMGFAALLFSQLIIFQAMPKISLVDVVLNKLFYVGAAIAEENIFRFYLFNMVYFGSGGGIKGFMYATAASTAVFVPYHMYVYQATVNLLIVAISNVILCSIYYLSSLRLSVPMLIHVCTNWVAA